MDTKKEEVFSQWLLLNSTDLSAIISWRVYYGAYGQDKLSAMCVIMALW